MIPFSDSAMILEFPKVDFFFPLLCLVCFLAATSLWVPLSSHISEQGVR